jgi:hypothetical protein
LLDEAGEQCAEEYEWHALEKHTDESVGKILHAE